MKKSIASNIKNLVYCFISNNKNLYIKLHSIFVKNKWWPKPPLFIHEKMNRETIYKYFSINGFKSGDDGRGASTVIILPSLSNNIKRGIPVIL